MMKTLIILLVMAFAVPVGAHPPQGIDAAYDLTSQTLSVDVAHNAGGERGHHIRRVDIYLNGSLYETTSFKQQVSRTNFKTSVHVDAEGGDVIVVKVFCSEGGTQSVELTVPKPEIEEETSP